VGHHSSMSSRGATDFRLCSNSEAGRQTAAGTSRGNDVGVGVGVPCISSGSIGITRPVTRAAHTHTLIPRCTRAPPGCRRRGGGGGHGRWFTKKSKPLVGGGVFLRASWLPGRNRNRNSLPLPLASCSRSGSIYYIHTHSASCRSDPIYTTPRHPYLSVTAKWTK
jgi:hypothetical protein